MANYTTSADLIEDILFRAGEPTDGSSGFDSIALSYLNRAYQTIWMGGSEFDPQVNEIWWWLYEEGRIQLIKSLEASGFSVTNSSAAVTAPSSPNSNLVGGFFQVTKSGENPTIHKVSAISGAAVTLDSNYLGATNASLAARIFKIDYDLDASVLRLVSPMTLSISNNAGSDYAMPGRDFQVLGVSNRRLAEIAPITNARDGLPRFFAQMGDQKVRFDQYPGPTTSPTWVDYAFLKRPADLANDIVEPLVPRQYRKVLSDIATFFLLIDKNDSRADAVSLVAKAGLRAMAVENRTRLQVYGAHIQRQLAPAPMIEAVGEGHMPRVSDPYQQAAGVPNAPTR